ncbi:sugar phosphate nucleotidyltransferase [Gemmatimonadota bacterium]
MSASPDDDRSTRKAVILAAGAGSRMRRGSPDVLDKDNRGAIRDGLKGMIRFHNRPFLDYALQLLVDAGLDDLCLVVSGQRSMLNEYYETMAGAMTGSRLSFAVQHEPLGTAHALLAAEEFTGGDPFLVVNCDNLYPVETITALKGMPAPALTLFDREGLLRGNIPADRIADMSLVETDDRGCMTRIIEKPGTEESATFDWDAPISMNSWHFGPEIFDACRAIPPHPARNEFEIPSAALHLVTRKGLCLMTTRFSLPVYDLTSVRDIKPVEKVTGAMRITLPAVSP